MIFGIRLKHFAKLESQGENVKVNFWIAWLLKRKSTKKFRVNHIHDITFSDFVDLERYYANSNYSDFCRIFVKKRFFETVYIHNMLLIMKEYVEQKNELIESNRYIFNPPQYGSEQKETIGSELRKEFVEEYGNYVVLMDVVCKGDLTRYKEVENWNVSEFFFWANYLTGQRILENIK